MRQHVSLRSFQIAKQVQKYVSDLFISLEIPTHVHVQYRYKSDTKSTKLETIKRTLKREKKKREVSFCEGLVFIYMYQKLFNATS